MMKDINVKKQIRIGSIFCGMGGFDCGLDFDTRWAIDIMPEACESFKQNHPHDTMVICQDAHTVDYSTLERVEGIVAGPPCQGFSRANASRRLTDPRNSGYLAVLRAISTLNPMFVIFENVQGILDFTFDDGSSVFEKIKSDYENCGMGYNFSWQLIDCATVGVPQANRFRMIGVGFRKDLGYQYNFLPLTHGVGEGLKPYVTLREAIGHLEHVDQTGDTYAGPYDWKFLSRNRYKSWNEVGFTIEASARYAKIHPSSPKMKWVGENKWQVAEGSRRLSILESKLLQTFPSNYIVCGSMEKKYEQIGNAVPPKLAEFIAKPIIEYFELLLRQRKEIEWLNAKLSKEYNKFYESLLNWIKSGHELTEKQRKYIA